MRPYLWVLLSGAWLFVSAFLLPQPLAAALFTAVVALALVGLAFADDARRSVHGSLVALPLLLGAGTALLPGLSGAARASDLVVAFLLLAVWMAQPAVGMVSEGRR